VRALRRRAPISALAVGLVAGDGGAAHDPARDVVRKTVGGRAVRRTDVEGRVRLVLPRAGRWLLRATDLRRPAPGDGALDWESDEATVTLSVR
jgi:hypothetical protein